MPRGGWFEDQIEDRHAFAILFREFDDQRLLDHRIETVEPLMFEKDLRCQEPVPGGFDRDVDVPRPLIGHSG